MKNSSKRIVAISFIQFFIVLIFAILATILALDVSVLAYLIPTSGAIAAAASMFYFNKAKMENLSKQRIRYVYLKLWLEENLSTEQYEEIEAIVSNIDAFIEDKMNSELQQAVEEETEISL